MKEKKYFDSLDKLKSGCATSQLFRSCERNGIWSFSPLPHLKEHVMRWNLMYGLIDGDTCRAEFVSRPLGGDPVCRLSWVGSPRGVRGHIEMMYGGQRSPGLQIEAI